MYPLLTSALPPPCPRCHHFLPGQPNRLQNGLPASTQPIQASQGSLGRCFTYVIRSSCNVKALPFLETKLLIVAQGPTRPAPSCPSPAQAQLVPSQTGYAASCPRAFAPAVCSSWNSLPTCHDSPYVQVHTHTHTHTHTHAGTLTAPS